MILIVDDEDNIRTLVQAMLKQDGRHLALATHLLAGLQSRRSPPAVLEAMPSPEAPFAP